VERRRLCRGPRISQAFVLVLYSLLLQDSIAFRVHAPSSVHPGEPVPIELVLTNRTERSLTLRLEGRPIAFEVTVSREDGTVVWRRSPGANEPHVAEERVLAPAESLTLEVVWDGRLADGRVPAPGRYHITGSMPTDSPERLSARPAPVQVLAVHPE